MKWSTWIGLYLSGWRPQRDVWATAPLPESFTVFPEAKRVMSAFAGLTYGDPLRSQCVSFNPMRGEEIAVQVRMFENSLGVRFYPIGVMEHQDVHYLLIDENGIVYTLIRIPDPNGDSFELEPLASSFERALEFLFKKAERCDIDEDLKSVNMLGRKWTIP